MAQDPRRGARGSLSQHDRDSLAHHAEILETQVAARTRDLQNAFDRLREASDAVGASYSDTSFRLAAPAEYRDEDTGKHVRRMGVYTRELAAFEESAEEVRRRAGISAGPGHPATAETAARLTAELEELQPRSPASTPKRAPQAIPDCGSGAQDVRPIGTEPASEAA